MTKQCLLTEMYQGPASFRSVVASRRSFVSNPSVKDATSERSSARAL